MIYGGQVANTSARHRKQERREVCSVKVAAPVYLDWSDKPITFDQGDHPDCVPSPGRYPLVVDPVIGKARLTKVLMDGGSSLNIIYAETLGLLGIDLSTIRVGAAPFHGIIPGKRVLPLGQHDLPVCFRTPSNFRKETFTFEVVGFRGTYHAVLGRPCYAKFMAVPNYTYLKLKMPGPNGVITIGSTYRHAYECDVECVEYVEVIAESEALIADLECLSKEVPDAKRHAGNFEQAEVVKSVPLDPSNDADKKVRIGFELGPQIGSSTRRLSPRKCQNFCVESLGHVGHTEGCRRALAGYPSWSPTREAASALFRRRKAQSHRRGDPQANGRRVHQRGIPF
jgi:hypothetical protein